MGAPAVETRWMDVSHFQGPVDWHALITGYHLDAGVAKCTEGTTFTDSQFARNWLSIKAEGKVRGGYHYANPSKSSGPAQAARLLAVCKPKPGDFVVLDLEASEGLHQGELNAWAAAFGDYIRANAPGITSILYAGRTYVGSGTGAGLGKHFDYLWTARYPGLTAWPTTVDPGLPANTTGMPASAWQWSDNVGGKDATVSSLTVAELRDPTLQQVEGALSVSDVTTILAEIDAIPAKVLALATIPSARVGDPSTPAGEQHSLATWISAIDASAYAAKMGLVGLTADAIADAVVAKLPAADGGSFTAAQLEALRQAVRDVLVGGTAAVPA